MESKKTLLSKIEPLVLNEDLWQIARYLQTRDISYDKSLHFHQTKKELKAQTKALIGEFFCLHDVNYLNEIFLSPSLSSLDGTSKIIRKVSPFALPLYIKFNPNKIVAYIKHHPFFDANIPRDIYCHIYLQYYNDLMAPSIYSHEIAHTQIEPTDIKDGCNWEFIAVFIEKLVAYTQGVPSFNMIQHYRMQSLKNSFNFIIESSDNSSKKISTSYIVSILKAEKLFDIYVNSDEYDKIFILQMVQLVLDGKLFLEDMLDFFGLNDLNKDYLTPIKRNDLLARRRH